MIRFSKKIKSLLKVKMSTQRCQQSLSGANDTAESQFSDISDTAGVPDRRRPTVPEVVVVRRWAVGVLGIWKGGGFG